MVAYSVVAIQGGRRAGLSKKRGNGEGSIHRRKGGGWCAQYTVYTAKGRKRKTLRKLADAPGTEPKELMKEE
jgi:hypothetical protein